MFLVKPIFNKDGIKFSFHELGKEKPIYTVYAKSEKDALNNVKEFLIKTGNSEIFYRLIPIK